MAATLENIATNVTNIAKEVSTLLENQGGSSVDVSQVQSIVDTTLSSKNYAKAFDYTKYIRHICYNNVTAAGVGLPVLYLSGDMTGISKENKKDMSFKYGDTIIRYTEGTCTLKWQGNSSLAFPKKNYTFAKLSTALDVGWGSQKKFVLKANMNDWSQARNVVSAKLWGDVVKARTGTDAVTTKLKTLPNGGAVDGFPIILVINDAFQGVYDLTIPKDENLFGMGSGSQEAIIGNESATNASLLKGELTEADLRNEVGMSIEYVPDEDNITWLVNSFNTMVNKVISATGANYRDTLDGYVDIDSFIDSLIFHMFTGNGDVVAKNSLLVTYDGVKWSSSVYDMDQAFGGHWQALQLTPPKSGATLAGLNGNRMWHLVQTYDKPTVKARYFALRENVLSENNVFNKFSNYLHKIPLSLHLRDEYVWNGLPDSSVDPVAYIMDYCRLRCQIVDKIFEAFPDA